MMNAAKEKLQDSSVAANESNKSKEVSVRNFIDKFKIRFS